MTTDKKAFVAGWPIAHSRSPLLHKHWLGKFGLPGDYEKINIHPDKIQGFLKSFGDLGYAGGNITLPHKEIAFKSVDEASERAKKLGAVNTVWLENGRIFGDNTDVYGFLANLDALAPGWSDNSGPAVVIGAGGAARAIIFALVERSFSPVWVLNRTPDRAEEVAEFFGDPVQAGGLDQLSSSLKDARIIVNTTSAGMAGSSPLQIDWSVTRPDAIVTDIVYYPVQTNFLKDAQTAGLTVVDGLGMLLHQAVPGFEQWFGKRPIVDSELRALILADIEG